MAEDKRSANHTTSFFNLIRNLLKKNFLINLNDKGWPWLIDSVVVIRWGTKMYVKIKFYS